MDRKSVPQGTVFNNLVMPLALTILCSLILTCLLWQWITE